MRLFLSYHLKIPISLLIFAQEFCLHLISRPHTLLNVMLISIYLWRQRWWWYFFPSTWHADDDYCSTKYSIIIGKREEEWKCMCEETGMKMKRNIFFSFYRKDNVKQLPVWVSAFDATLWLYIYAEYITYLFLDMKKKMRQKSARDGWRKFMTEIALFVASFNVASLVYKLNSFSLSLLATSWCFPLSVY